MSSKEMVDRAHRIRASQEALIADTPSEELIGECLDRLIPILTHKQPVSYMSIPVDHARDDDCFILDRLREVQCRVKLVQPELAPEKTK